MRSILGLKMALLRNAFLLNLLTVGLLMSGSLSAYSKPNYQRVDAKKSEWKPFTSTKSGFNIQFPAQPQHVEQTIEVPQTDMKISYNTYLSEPSDAVVYVVSVWNYPVEIDMDDPKQNLQDGFSGMLSALPGAQVEMMQMGSTQGFDSLEFKVKSDEIFFRGKLILVHHTLFQVFTVYRSDLESEKDYAHFIQSLELINPKMHQAEPKGKLGSPRSQSVWF